MSTSRKKQYTATTPQPADFEQSLQKLNQLIEKMESEQLSLEVSLQCFEDGIALVRHCQHTLNQAEQKVQLLTQKAVTDFKKKDD